ncbi:hypothetical protein GRF29_106g482584 [Pseudopithomyces chartarum]|uniref:Uncharacterized protein n=1 Tax=Pseudopithomyces chartarum TaxID=1892770 RepID=A0AAN6RFI3_9PLEO|nr:hypothetical protein GRF29_106g482584 [Pseudopithomyces chartarum]
MALSSEQSKKQSQTQTQTQTQTQKQQSTHPSSLQSKAGVQHPDSCPRDSGKHANSNVGRKSTGNGGGGRNGDEANKGEHGPGVTFVLYPTTSVAPHAASYSSFPIQGQKAAPMMAFDAYNVHSLPV